MNVLIIGYGKMGRNIERLALQQKHRIVATVDNETEWLIAKPLLKNCDVAIVFTIPEFAVDYILKCFRENIPVVIGTTGWNDRMKEIRDYTIENDKTLLYASNFSIGVNIMFDINRRLAAMAKRFGGYDVHIEETHHVNKLDAPSGTAITLAEGIMESGDVEIESIRHGNIVGEHKVIYDSEIDTIVISHAAKNRDGFAFGAIMAAQWIVGRKGFFTMSDVMN